MLGSRFRNDKIFLGEMRDVVRDVGRLVLIVATPALTAKTLKVGPLNGRRGRTLAVQRPPLMGMCWPGFWNGLLTERKSPSQGRAFFTALNQLRKVARSVSESGGAIAATPGPISRLCLSTSASN